jgi:predicted phage terminase large subunit-like protein
MANKPIDRKQVEQLALEGATDADIARDLGYGLKRLVAHCSGLMRRARARRRNKIHRWIWESAEKGTVSVQLWLAREVLSNASNAPEKPSPPAVTPEQMNRMLTDNAILQSTCERDESRAAPAPAPAPARGGDPSGFAYEASGGRWVCPNHLRLLNRKLLDVARGSTPRLLIAMPPRHGKSEFASKYFPAWYLGAFPDRHVILASYQAEFAASWGRKVRDVLAEHGPTVFGHAVRRDVASAEHWELAGSGGGMDTAGVGGALTGKGADLLIIDDPVKNADEANSPTFRDRAWDWYVSTAYTRLQPGGTIVLIQTRWHEDDLAGRVLADARAGGEPWEVVELPALAEADDPLGRKPGEALWPERYSVESLARIERTLGPSWFAALYQQRPAPAAGNRFKRRWFRYWSPEDGGHLYRLHGLTEQVIPARACRRFGTLDLAVSTRTSADYTVLAAWAVTPQADLVLLDLVRERFEEPDLVRQAAAFARRHLLDYVVIEANGMQLGIVQTLRRPPYNLTVKAIHSDHDKLSRAITAIIRCDSGQLFFPERAAWLADFEAELLNFPVAAHDDQVDALSLAALDVFLFGHPAPPTLPQIDPERDRPRIDHPIFGGF